MVLQGKPSVPTYLKGHNSFHYDSGLLLELLCGLDNSIPKPCPYCSSTHVLVTLGHSYRGDPLFFVMCDECGATGPVEQYFSLFSQDNNHFIAIEYRVAKAIELWNKRDGIGLYTDEGGIEVYLDYLHATTRRFLNDYPCIFCKNTLIGSGHSGAHEFRKCDKCNSQGPITVRSLVLDYREVQAKATILWNRRTLYKNTRLVKQEKQKKYTQKEFDKAFGMPHEFNVGDVVMYSYQTNIKEKDGWRNKWMLGVGRIKKVHAYCPGPPSYEIASKRDWCGRKNSRRQQLHEGELIAAPARYKLWAVWPYHAPVTDKDFKTINSEILKKRAGVKR